MANHIRLREGVGSGAFILKNRDTQSGGLEHKFVVAPITNAYGVIRIQLLYIGTLSFRLVILGENRNVTVQAGQACANFPEGVSGDDVDT